MKTGRPKKNLTGKHVISVGVTVSEKFIMCEKAATTGLSLSSYVRKMAIYGQVPARFTEEERQFIRQLISMSSNLNQLTKVAHQEGMLKALLYFEDYRNRIDDILNHIENDK